MTQGRKWWRCGQGRMVQIDTVVTGAVKRAKRLALVLALVGVVTTAAGVGLSAHLAEAAGYYWQGWLTPSEAAYWEMACYYDYRGYPLYVADMDYYGHVYGAYTLGVYAYKQYIICSPY